MNHLDDGWLDTQRSLALSVALLCFAMLVLGFLAGLAAAALVVLP